MKQLIRNQYFWPLLITVLLLLFNALFTPYFFRLEIIDGHLYGRVIDVMKNAAPLMMLALGMTLVIASGGIDISVGSVIAISGAVGCSIVDGRMAGIPQNLAVALILALFAGALCGFWNGFLVTRFKIQPVVATLILLTAGRGVAQLITHGKIVTINSSPLMEPYYFIGAGYLFTLPLAFLLACLVLVVLLFFTNRTSFGLFLKASGISKEASYMAGIDVGTIKIVVYTLSGVFAAVAGLMISSNIKGADCNNAGLFMEMDAILAVTIAGNSMNGGRFSLTASILGALIIQLLTTTIYAFGVPPETIALVKAIVVIAICLLQSEAFRDKFRIKKRVLS